MEKIKFLLVAIISLSLPRFLFAGPVVTEGLMTALENKNEFLDVKLVIKRSLRINTRTDWRHEFSKEVSSYIQKINWFPHRDFERGQTSPTAMRGIETPLSSKNYKFAAGTIRFRKADIGKLFGNNKVVWLGLTEDDHMAVELPVYYPSDKKVLKDNQEMLEKVAKEVAENDESGKILPIQNLIPLQYVEETEGDEAGYFYAHWLVSSMKNNGQNFSAIPYVALQMGKKIEYKRINELTLKNVLPELFTPGKAYPAVMPSFGNLPSEENLTKLNRQVLKEIMNWFTDERLKKDEAFADVFRQYRTKESDRSLFNFGAMKALPLRLGVHQAFYLVSLPMVAVPVEAYSLQSSFFLVSLNKNRLDKKWSISAVRLVHSRDCSKILLSMASAD